MASLYGRTIFQVTRRGLSTSLINCSQKTLPDPLELATGLEKKELLARIAGNDDPFMMKSMKRGPGTKEQPNLVPSAFDCRVVGCVCETDSTSVVWMWLHEGQPKRCGCGHWFKLDRKPGIVERN